jgi:hypothetical protein
VFPTWCRIYMFVNKTESKCFLYWFGWTLQVENGSGRFIEVRLYPKVVIRKKKKYEALRLHQKTSFVLLLILVISYCSWSCEIR